jgi:hypothetical protein
LVLALLPLDLSLAEDGILWYFLFYGGWWLVTLGSKFLVDWILFPRTKSVVGIRRNFCFDKASLSLLTMIHSHRLVSVVEFVLDKLKSLLWVLDRLVFR